MKWVLIFLMFQRGYAGGAIETAEFNTEEACTAAAVAVNTTEWANVQTYCYPTGEPVEAPKLD